MRTVILLALALAFTGLSAPASAECVPADDAAARVCTSDRNGDGVPDTASVATSDPRVVLAASDGNGDGAPESPYASVGPAGAYVFAGDANRDGVPDMLLAGGSNDALGSGAIVASRLTGSGLPSVYGAFVTPSHGPAGANSLFFNAGCYTLGAANCATPGGYALLRSDHLGFWNFYAYRHESTGPFGTTTFVWLTGRGTPLGDGGLFYNPEVNYQCSDRDQDLDCETSSGRVDADAMGLAKVRATLREYEYTNPAQRGATGSASTGPATPLAGNAVGATAACSDAGVDEDCDGVTATGTADGRGAAGEYGFVMVRSSEAGTEVCSSEAPGAPPTCSRLA